MASDLVSWACPPSSPNSRALNRPEEARHRSDVDDAAATGGQVLQRGLTDAHRPVEVDVDDCVEDLRLVLLSTTDDTCTVDNHVNVVEAGDEGPD